MRVTRRSGGKDPHTLADNVGEASQNAAYLCSPKRQGTAGASGLMDVSDGMMCIHRLSGHKEANQFGHLYSRFTDSARVTSEHNLRRAHGPLHIARTLPLTRSFNSSRDNGTRRRRGVCGTEEELTLCSRYHRKCGEGGATVHYHFFVRSAVVALDTLFLCRHHGLWSHEILVGECVRWYLSLDLT